MQREREATKSKKPPGKQADKLRAHTYPAQAFDAMQYFYGDVQPPRIRCHIRFTGRVNVPALRGAMEACQSAHPLLGCVFHPGRHRWEAAEPAAPAPLRELEQPDEASVLQCLLSPLDETREPQWKLFLIHLPDGDELCVIINHMVCDGAGFKEVLYELAENYSRIMAGGKLLPRPEAPDSRRFNRLLHALGLRSRLRVLLSPGHPFKRLAPPLLPYRGGPGSPMLILKRLPPEQFSAVRRYAHATGTSVNDVLLTAYLRALHTVTGRDDVAVPCPVDLRRFAAPGQAFGLCNLTGNYWCRLTLSVSEPFGVSLKRVSGQMRAQKNSVACLKEPMLFHALYGVIPFALLHKLFRRMGGVPVTSYSNLGVLNDERLRFAGCEIADTYLATAVKRPPYYQLSLSTWRNVCTLSSCVDASEEDRKIVEKVINTVVKELNIQSY